MSSLKLSNKVLGTYMLIVSFILFVVFLSLTCLLWYFSGDVYKCFSIISIMLSELSLGFMFAGDKIRKMKDN